MNESLSGTLTTTLCEDVYSIVYVQIEVINEYVLTSGLLNTEVGNAILLEGLLSIIRNLALKQICFRGTFLTDLESCCAAANDFFRMMEHAEDLMVYLEKKNKRFKWGPENSRVSILNREVEDLLHLYSNDAIYAVQRAHLFVLSTIQQSSIPKDLFSRCWETKFTHNEVAITLVKTLEDFLYDFHNFLSNDFLYQKIVAALVQAVVCFYVRRLIQKADKLRRRGRFGRVGFAPGEEPFGNVARAHCRMMYDIETFQTYFRQLARQTPALTKLVEHELDTLVVIHEFIGIAIGNVDITSREEFIVVLHKRTGGNVAVTRCLVTDLWFLVAFPGKECDYNQTLDRMKVELEHISSRLEKADLSKPPATSGQLTCLRLDEMLKEFYTDRIIQESNPLCGALIHSVKANMPNATDLPAVPFPQHTKLETDEKEPLIFGISQGKKDIPAHSAKTSMLIHFRNFHEHLLTTLKLHNLHFLFVELERKAARPPAWWQ